MAWHGIANNNIKLIKAILLRQQQGHVVGYPWLQGFDDGLAGDAGKCTWQCVTCLDMGVQLHLNEGGIVYCAHILSNTPHILQLPTHMCAAAPGMQLITTNRTDHRHCHISHKTVAKSMKIRLKAVSISLVFHVVSVLGDQIQQCCSSHLHNQVVGESPLVQTKRRSEEMEASLPRHP